MRAAELEDRHRVLTLMICDLGLKDTSLLPLLLHQVPVRARIPTLSGAAAAGAQH